MKKIFKSILCLSVLITLLLVSEATFAWNTSYVYFNVIDNSTGSTCREVIVNTSTQEAKYSRGVPYTTEKVGDCIDYKVMGCRKVYDKDGCYRVKDAWDQTVEVRLR